MVEQKHGVRTASLRDTLYMLAGNSEGVDIPTLMEQTGLSYRAVRNYLRDHPGEIGIEGRGEDTRVFIRQGIDHASFTGAGVRVSPSTGYNPGNKEHSIHSSRGKKWWKHRLGE